MEYAITRINNNNSETLNLEKIGFGFIELPVICDGSLLKPGKRVNIFVLYGLHRLHDCTIFRERGK